MGNTGMCAYPCALHMNGVSKKILNRVDSDQTLHIIVWGSILVALIGRLSTFPYESIDLYGKPPFSVNT